MAHSELDRAIMERAILLRRKHRLKIPDAIVAATALFHNIPLLTADRVFERVKDELLVVMYEIG